MLLFLCLSFNFNGIRNSRAYNMPRTYMKIIDLVGVGACEVNCSRNKSALKI